MERGLQGTGSPVVHVASCWEHAMPVSQFLEAVL